MAARQRNLATVRGLQNEERRVPEGRAALENESVRSDYAVGGPDGRIGAPEPEDDELEAGGDAGGGEDGCGGGAERTSGAGRDGISRATGGGAERVSVCGAWR